MKKKLEWFLFSVAIGYIFLFVSFNCVYGYSLGQGISMEPTLTQNDVMFYNTFESFDNDLTNRIVAYHSEYTHNIVCHRVIEDNGETLICKGDNNEGVDPEIVRSQIVEVVSFVVPFECCFIIMSGFVASTFFSEGYLVGIVKSEE